MPDNNPYDDLVAPNAGSGGGGGGAGGGGGGGDDFDNAQYDFTPEETQAQSFAYADLFGDIPEYWALNAPDTIMKITLPENQIYRQASVQAFQYLQLIYGPDLTPTLQAALIPSKDQREYAYEVLQQIAQQDFAPITTIARVPEAAAEPEVDAELMSRVLADPGMLDTLDPATKNAVIRQARVAGQALQGNTANTARQFSLITGQTAHQSYDVFLSPEEKTALEQVLGYAQEGFQAPTLGRGPNVAAVKSQEVLGQVGVSSIQNAGNPNPTVIMDEEWARARPVRAAAVMDFMRTQLPNVAFRVGEKGLVGKVLDVLGKPVDVVSAIPGAAFRLVSENAEELLDRGAYDESDRARMAQEAESLRQKLSRGEVQPDQWDDTIRSITHLEEEAEDNISFDFGEAIDLNLHPREAGWGFAENFTDGLDLLPGDPGHDVAYAVSGLVANLVFDPLNFALPAIAGARAARAGIGGAAELAGKVDYTLDAFRIMGNAPDATKVARRSVQGILPAAPKPIKDVIGKGRYVILENADDIGVTLKSRGYKVGSAKLNGKDAVLVPGATLEEGIHLAREAGLPTFLSTEGIVDVGSRTVRRVEKYLDSAHNATDVASFGGKTWGYRIGNRTTKLRPERIAGGYTKNYFYRKLVKSPEEWITTKPAQQAVDRLWTVHQSTSREVFMARVQRLFGVDERTTRFLANARTRDDLAMAVQHAMTGGVDAAFNEGRVQARLSEAVARLDEYDSLKASGASPESIRADFTSAPAKRFTAEEDLSALGARDDDFYYHMTPAENLSPIADEGIQPRQSFYGMEPSFVPPEMRVGRAFVAEDPEIARHATRFANDRAIIRVPKTDVDGLGLRPDTAPVEGSFYATQSIPMGNAEYLTEAGEWKPLIQRADPRLSELEATRVDDVAEVSYLRSMSNGRDFQVALRELPNSRQWRSFLGKEGRGPIGRGMIAMAEFAERFPGNLLGMGPKRLAQFLLTPEGRVAEKSAKQASIGLGRLFGNHGASGDLIFPWMARQEGQLVDEVAQSADTVRNIMRTFAVPRDKAERVIGRFLDSRNERQGFEWVKDFWGTIADDSPLLNSIGRDQVRKAWNTPLSERSPGYITTSKPGEFLKTEPTLFRVAEDERGNLVRSGVPVFTADMFQGSYHLPPIETILEYTSFNRRLLANWSKAGGGKQVIASGFLQGRRAADAVGRWWKTLVLMGKLPFSLPTRIVGEEMVRIAAFDEASLVNHPIAWLRSVRHADEFELFAESNAAHLGLLGEQMLSRVRKTGQGRHIYNIQDGEPYFKAASVKIAKLAKSPEVKRWYLGRTPEESLAIMESGQARKVFDVSDDVGIERISGERARITGWHGHGKDFDPLSGQQLGFGDTFHFGTKGAAEGRNADTTSVVGATDLTPVSVEGKFLGLDEPLTEADNTILEAGGVEEAINSDLLDPFQLPQMDAATAARLEGGPWEEVDAWVRENALSPTIKSLDAAARRQGKTIREILTERGYEGYVYTNEVEAPGSLSVATFGSRNVKRVEGRIEEAGLAGGAGDILALWDELIDPRGIKSRLDAARRAHQELDQLAQGNETILAAMRNGRMTVDGNVVEAGTQEFADELARMHAAGEWKPTALELPASTAEFEIVSPKPGFSRFRDWTFQNFYTRPDVFMARAPLFRSIALREMKRLRSLGWSEGRALESGKAFAARRTADMLYKVGETSAAHYWLRNIAPFFPAWQELTTTWLYRIPKAMGGGFWAPGAIRLTRKADAFMQFFKDLGVIEKNENGEWMVPIPGMGPLLAAITGSPVPFKARAHLSSFTGVLPDPFSGVQGLLPGLGAPASAALTVAASKFDGVVDDFADYLLPFGRDVSLGPSLVDRLFIAAGIEPPWTFGSPDFQKALKNYAIDDGIRIELANPEGRPIKIFIRDKRLRKNALAAMKRWNVAVGFTVFEEAKTLEGAIPLTVVGNLGEESGLTAEGEDNVVAGAAEREGDFGVRIDAQFLDNVVIYKHELGHILGLTGEDWHDSPGIMTGDADNAGSITPQEIAGVRQLFLERGRMPKREEYDSEENFNRAYQRWSEGILERAESRANVQYVVRGLSAAILPFSATYDTKYDTEMQKMWAQLASYPGGDEITGPMIDAFKAQYPEAVWWVNGKTINLDKDRNFSRTDAFAIEWTDQHRHEMTPDEYLRWTVGMQSFSVFMNKLDGAYDALGSSPSEVLLNGFQKFETIAPLRAEWEDYLEWTDHVTPEGERSFHDLYKIWQKAKGNNLDELTETQEVSLAILDATSEGAKLFTESGIRDSSWKDVRRVAGAALGDLGEPSTPIGQAIKWYWDNVGGPYGDQVSAIYDKLAVTDDPFKKAQMYAEIRDLANNAPREKRGGVTFPTPEEVFFGNLSPDEQSLRKLEWAALPVEWLTNFQMKQIGLKSSPKLEELTKFLNENEAAFDYLVASNDIYPSSNDYENLRHQFDARAVEKARDLGMGKQFLIIKEPVHKRIDRFFGKEFNNETWNQVVRMADQGLAAIENAAEGSITDTREAVGKWLVQNVRQFKKNDETFRKLMDEQLAKAFAPSGKDVMSPDLLILKLFLGYWDDKAPDYLYVN